MPPPSPPHPTQGLSDTTKGLLAGLLVVRLVRVQHRLALWHKGLFTPYDLAAMRYGVSGLLGGLYFLRNAPFADWPRYLALSVFGGLGYGLFVYSGFVRPQRPRRDLRECVAPGRRAIRMMVSAGGGRSGCRPYGKLYIRQIMQSQRLWKVAGVAVAKKRSGRDLAAADIPASST
jgi:hypothetical protein